MLLKHPAKLELHLAERLSGDPGRDADLLLALLHETPLASLPVKDRLVSLITLWPHANDTLSQIEQRVRSNHIPLSPAAQTMAQAHQRLSETLLGLFKQTVMDLQGSREPWWRTSRRLLALTYAADLSTRLGLMCRLCYQDLPKGYWRAWHELVLEAECTGHLRDHLNDPAGSPKQIPSLEERYVSMALLEVSMPDGLPHQEIGPFHHCLLALASHTRLEPQTGLTEERPLIQVDLKLVFCVGYMFLLIKAWRWGWKSLPTARWPCASPRPIATQPLGLMPCF